MCNVGNSASHREFALQLAAAAMLFAGLLAAAPVWAQETPPPGPPQFQANEPHAPPSQYSSVEIVDAGHHFFGGISKGMALVVEKAAAQWGQPNGYILGEEAGGAFIGGLRYGDGTLYTKNAGDMRVFWQGPTIGVDAGAVVEPAELGKNFQSLVNNRFVVAVPAPSKAAAKLRSGALREIG